ncbi:MAG: hypothetical protein U0T83_10965 [Bacteriovoracaceae bacterium]
MKYIFFIDYLEKINTKKDTSIFMAHTYKAQGHEVYLLFENDFYYFNKQKLELPLYEFESTLNRDDFYLKAFKLKTKVVRPIKKGDVLFYRLDPPFDQRYLRYLWLLDNLQDSGLIVSNNPRGILTYNEKLFAYKQPESIDTYVGGSFNYFLKFIQVYQKKKVTEFILKPIDLYQGIGVEKIRILPSTAEAQIKKIFDRKLKELGGLLILQPFVKSVSNGEIRSIFYKGKELGSILKIPKKGEYLANIAQGAQYEVIKLTPKLKSLCTNVAKHLGRVGVDLIAYDLLDEKFSEINITCPGLLVEVSNALNKNLAQTMVEMD